MKCNPCQLGNHTGSNGTTGCSATDCDCTCDYVDIVARLADQITKVRTVAEEHGFQEITDPEYLQDHGVEESGVLLMRPDGSEVVFDDDFTVQLVTFSCVTLTVDADELLPIDVAWWLPAFFAGVELGGEA